MSGGKEKDWEEAFWKSAAKERAEKLEELKTLRDLYAGIILLGDMRGPITTRSGRQEFAKAAFGMAEEMVRERQRRKDEDLFLPDPGKDPDGGS